MFSFNSTKWGINSTKLKLKILQVLNFEKFEFNSLTIKQYLLLVYVDSAQGSTRLHLRTRK